MNESDLCVTVVVPADPPLLNQSSARALLGILVELTTVEILDGPADGDHENG